MCEMYADIQDIKATISDMYDGPYNTLCLTGVTSTSKLPEITQAIISDLCETISDLADLTTTVSTMSSTLTTTIGTFLSGAINSCQTDAVKKSGTGATFNVTFSGLCPIGTIMMYGGPISGVFDSNGLGISPGPACGWALCNGRTHAGIPTVDMRGYFPVGVNDGTMGSASQNSEVDNAINPGQGYSFNAHGGEIKHTLTSTEIPPTSVTIIDNHTHDITGVSMCKSTGNISNNAWVLDLATSVSGTCPTDALSAPYNIAHTFSGKISTPTGSITGTVNGQGRAHENRPPFRAIYFIQRVA